MRLMSTKPQISRTPPSVPREIKFRPPASLLLNPRNARVHPKGQIRKIANSITAFGQLVPTVIDENGVAPKGHATLDAANTLKLSTAPTVTVSGLSEERKRAFVIAEIG
jgi:ParB-like chromosome segregation protein Spo0J